jgi:hypothetical protein
VATLRAKKLCGITRLATPASNYEPDEKQLSTSQFDELLIGLGGVFAGDCSSV